MRWLVINLNPGQHFRNDTEIDIDRTHRVETIFTNSGSAHQRAQELAIKTPTAQYAVMAVEKVYETTTPKVIMKKLDSRGQLVLDQQEGSQS